MDIVMKVLIGLIGAVLGFVIPDIAQGISEYKYRKKDSVLERDLRYLSLSLKLELGLLNALVWSLAGLYSQNLLSAILISLLISTAVLIAIIDVRIRIVPNELLLIMLIEGLSFQALSFGLAAVLTSAVCMIAMIVFFSIVASGLGFDKVGAGDVKLAGAMGLALGYPNTLTALIVMSAVFVVFSLTGLIMKKLTLKTMLPFAPFMMIGMVFTLAYMVYC